VGTGWGTSISLWNGNIQIDSGYSRVDRACGLNALPAGTYLVEIEGYSSDQTLSYDVSITCLPCDVPNPTPTATATPTATPTPLQIDTYEPDNAPGAAKPITCGSTQTHTIVPAGDADWVSLSLDELTDVVIEMTSTALTTLSLHDSSGAVLESSDSRIGRACGLDPLPAGTYLIEFVGYFSWQTLSYDVSVTCLPCGIPNPAQTATSTSTQRVTPTATASATDAATATGTPTETPMACVGDCEDRGTATVTDIITMVNTALGTVGLTACPAGDANGDNQITVDEILMAVHNALSGCPGGPEQQTARPLTRGR